MPPEGQVDRPFGAENREALLNEFFHGWGTVTRQNAWKAVYQLLMWVDPTTGLAAANAELRRLRERFAL